MSKYKLSQAEALLKLGIRQTGETLVCCRYDGEPMDLYSHVLSGMHEEAAERVDNALQAALKRRPKTT